MQNFGRGMWRRVGDFERIKKPTYLNQFRIEQLQKLIDYEQTINQQVNDNLFPPSKKLTANYKLNNF
jgi:hypothetical protein